jgi:hypothetical protein
MADINVIMDEGALDELITNDDVATDVAEAVAENAGAFEFDLTSGLIGLGVGILVPLGYKYIPIWWKKLTDKFGKKTETEEDIEVEVEDDEDEDDSDDTEATEDSESKGDEETGETHKPNRAERRDNKNKNKNK